MKKITFVLTSVFFVAGLVSGARADNYKYTPYVGVDYTYSRTKANEFKPIHNSLGLHIGSDYSKYFGTEMFFAQSDADKKRPQEQKIKTSYRAYGLDLMAYLPLGCTKRFSLLATAGLGEYVYKTKVYQNKHHNEHGYGYRFGGGAKYAFDNHWQARFITRYVKFDRLTNYKHNMEYNFSLEYHF